MMTTSNESEAAKPAGPPSTPPRIGTLVRWAARITSLPIFGLLLISLIPALGSFAISPREDRLIALGLCGTALGFLIGWRWAGLGGGLAAAGVALIISQADGSILADPFTVAFGLQAILFLVSWSLNSNSAKGATPRIGWVKKVAAGLLVVSAAAGAFVIYRGPGPVSVPKDKEAYVGVWESNAGFTLEITAEGRARVSQAKDAKIDPWNTPVKPGETNEFLVTFRADEKLELSSGPLTEPKVYHIDRHPFPQAKQIKMVLNGSDPYKRASGFALVKKPPLPAQAPPPKLQAAPQTNDPAKKTDAKAAKS
jgi:hypothetical protein